MMLSAPSATVAQKIDPAAADAAVRVSPAGLRRTTVTRHPAWVGGLRGRPLWQQEARGGQAGPNPPYSLYRWKGCRWKGCP
jgi:hypothetical protein